MFKLIKNASLLKLILILIIVGFLTYASSFNNKFVWDDDHFFQQNLFTQSLSIRNLHAMFTSNTTAGAGVSSNYYRPLTTLTFALDHQLWGWNPPGLHFTNTAIHVTNSILLFLLLFLLRFPKASSFAVSLLFLIHPIQTEAVTYLSSRGNILYTFFLLLSLILFTLALYKDRYILSMRFFRKEREIVFSKTYLLTVSILLFPLSCLSKEGALTTVPIYAGILMVIAVQKKYSLKQTHEKYRNHIIAILLIGWTTLVYFGLRLTLLNFNDSLNYSGDQSIYSKSLLVRFLTFLKTIIIYIRLLLIPYPLYLERSTEIVTSFANWWVVGAISVIMASIALGIREYYKKHTAWIFFALIIIFANLLSVSGIIPMTGLLRENWLYMPMIGFYMILISLFSYLFSIFRFQPIVLRFFSFLFVVYCLILIGVTMQQNYHWRDRIAYFEHNLKYTNTPRLHLNLGNAYLGIGDEQKALKELQEAVALYDAYPQTHYNIANIYKHRGDLVAAEKEYLKSLELDPNYLYSYPMLLQIYEKKREYKKQLPYLNRLTKIYPEDLKIKLMYAKALWDSEMFEEADKEFAESLELSHNDPKLINAIKQTKQHK